jgi:hypothetical protein
MKENRREARVENRKRNQLGVRKYRREVWVKKILSARVPMSRYC